MSVVRTARDAIRVVDTPTVRIALPTTHYSASPREVFTTDIQTALLTTRYSAAPGAGCSDPARPTLAPMRDRRTPNATAAAVRGLRVGVAVSRYHGDVTSALAAGARDAFAA